MQNAVYRIAIDVGGTFTDIVLLDMRSGELLFGKVLTTPDDASRGSLEGASAILEEKAVPAAEVRDLVHATTVATNAVLERRGAETALITTRGFRDTLEMGREARYDIYDLGLRTPEPLVPRVKRVEVDERLAADGSLLEELDETAAAETIERLCKVGDVESIAICLLHSYLRPDHEQRVAALIKRLFPHVALSVSSEVAGEVREYERMSTAVVDAYVKPMVQGYIGRLSEGLRDLGLKNPISIMLSHGGVGPAEEVADRFPVRMIESGPAAGAIAASYIARRTIDPADALAFDMGGTTAKMSIIRGGETRVTHEYEVGHVHRFKHGSGLPLQITAVELLEIGAGGGSIAHLSKLGLLNVGPRSAGAAPGPACYGRGGTKPTVTDADLVLGYLDPNNFLGGEMILNEQLSRDAIEDELAEALDMSVEDVAWGIHDLVNEKMAAATRAHAAEVGIDLRRHTMIAFGGAGPVHAYAIARKLNVPRIICPIGAGVASAVGCLVAPPAYDAVTAYPAILEAIDWPHMLSAFDTMYAEGTRSIAAMGETGVEPRLVCSADLRCEGQGYSVTVPMEGDVANREATIAAMRTRFGDIYAQVYGHRPPPVPLEVINLRARVEHEMVLPELRHRSKERPEPAGSPLKGERSVYFEAAGRFVRTPVLDRYRLAVGRVVEGPAVIEERETTTVVGPDARFGVDLAGHLIIDLKLRQGAE